MVNGTVPEEAISLDVRERAGPLAGPPVVPGRGTAAEAAVAGAERLGGLVLVYGGFDIPVNPFGIAWAERASRRGAAIAGFGLGAGRFGRANLAREVLSQSLICRMNK
jgi:hypothetical protein